MKRLTCDRCKTKIGLSNKEEENKVFYDVRRSSDWSKFGHKGEKYICDSCMSTDPRYIAEQNKAFIAVTK